MFHFLSYNLNSHDSKSITFFTSKNLYWIIVGFIILLLYQAIIIGLQSTDSQVWLFHLMICYTSPVKHSKCDVDSISDPLLYMVISQKPICYYLNGYEVLPFFFNFSPIFETTSNINLGFPNHYRNELKFYYMDTCWLPFLNETLYAISRYFLCFLHTIDLLYTQD